MELPTTGLIPEIERARARVAKNKALDARAELVENVYPLLQMMAQMSGQVMMDHDERLAQAEIAIAELATSGDSIVLPELADSIDGVLELGLRLCTVTEILAAGNTDSEEHGAALNEVTDLVAKYRSSTNELREDLDDVVVDDGVPDEDGAEGAPTESE